MRSGCLTKSDAERDFWVKVVTGSSPLARGRGGPSLGFANLWLIQGILSLTASPARQLFVSLGGVSVSYSRLGGGSTLLPFFIQLVSNLLHQDIPQMDQHLFEPVQTYSRFLCLKVKHIL